MTYQVLKCEQVLEWAAQTVERDALERPYNGNIVLFIDFKTFNPGLATVKPLE